MNTCDDSIHNGICFYQSNTPNITKCPHFKDKSRYIELPCGVGTTVYKIYADDCGGNCIEFCEFCTDARWKLVETKFSVSLFDDIGYTVFLTKEEAEKALKERGGK